MEFLSGKEFRSIPFNLDFKGLVPLGLYLGKGQHALEVAVFSSIKKPLISDLHNAFKKRKSGRASPVLIVVLFDGGVSICGTGGDQPPIFNSEDINQVERLCESALKLPDRNAAILFLSNTMPSLETSLPGVTNEGLFSLHELSYGTKNSSDWNNAVLKAKKLLGRSGDELITELGFERKSLDNLTELLTVDQERTALAVLLKDQEIPELGNKRFSDMSPVSYALTRADKEKLPWVIIIKGNRIRLYSTKNIGVGRRGRTESYIECQLSLMVSKDIGLIWMIFSSDALKEGGTINFVLENSKRFAANVADKLRDRIYDVVVPEIAMGIVKVQNLSNPSKEEIQLTYEMALTVLFRLLFIAYAEDRDLLPYKGNEAYRVRSLKYKARELADVASKKMPLSDGNHHWVETSKLWEAVSQGNLEWGIPAYGGTIFSNDISVSHVGAKLEKITLPNNCFELALRSLLLTDTEENEFAPVDFRALSVREFGTIYEGLLESELSLAQQNLVRDKKGIYIPAKQNDEIDVKTGQIYLHNRSGSRKATGSYYTPDFAVEHLLDGALEPAIDEHLAELSLLDEVSRSEKFFDFRIADIAMGSGHFLVAAIDRIERRFALWLEENHSPIILKELQFLRETAKRQLGDLENSVLIEDGQILRRMIARRCIYGVDINPITVQLARLSIWIHTFVPGLPLSLLDHNLVHGNSLIGVGSLNEIKRKFNESSGTLFAVDADNLLGEASEPLEKLAKLSDGSIKDILSGRALMEEARLKTLETKALCDLITAQPVAEDLQLKDFQFEDWERIRKEIHGSKALLRAKEILEPLSAMHFPVTFPEVFLGRSQGFNVILGNPPWEKVKVEEYNFWAQKFPGLRGLSQRDFEIRKKELYKDRSDLVQELNAEKSSNNYLREVLHSSSAYDLGAGDPDLYQAFSWRFFSLLAKSGHIGVVMPRSLLNAKGSEKLRKTMFINPNFVDATILTNKSRWIFDMEPRYTIALLCFKKNSVKEKGIILKGPFNSIEEFLDKPKVGNNLFSFDEVKSWNDSYSIPSFPKSNSFSIFETLKLQKNLILDKYVKWGFYPDTELHATNQKYLMDLVSEECPKNFWPIYKGDSFNIWNPDTGSIYAWADPENVFEFIQKKRKRGWKIGKGSHKNFTEKYIKDVSTISSNKARIAFRDITNRTNRRTVICALIPPKVFLTHKAPYFLKPYGDEKDEAFLLGVLSSIPLDWYSRRFVETNLTYFILEGFPIPRPERDNPLWKRVVELSGRLACPDSRFSEWASKVGVDYGNLEQNDKDEMIYELDAVVSQLYGLSEKQVIHIFETFHENWDYRLRLNIVLKYFRLWEDRR